MYTTFIKFLNYMKFGKKQRIWKTLKVETKVSFGRYELGAYW